MTVRRTYVRPSASQGHQYEVAYTGYNPVLNPVFLARNRMLTRVVAKQAKTTKVKNKFVNGKRFQKNTPLAFWWKAKGSVKAKEIRR